MIAGRAELFPLPEGEGKREGEQSELWPVGANLQKLSNGASPPAKPGYVFSTVVGMARCAVPARVVAGGTNIRGTLPFEELRRCTQRGHRSAMSLPGCTHMGERAVLRVNRTPAVSAASALHSAPDDRPKGRMALSHSSFQASSFAGGC